ncbi:MAG: YjdF family protein [Acutalibacteraceae bacterium]
MSHASGVSSLTVLFEEPFWVGILERSDGKRYEVCKIIFGAEPTDGEVYEFLLKNYNRLRFSRPVRTGPIVEHRINPKRMQRIIKKQTENTGIGTKAQQALALEREQNKLERKTKTREMKEAEKLLRFEQKQKKKKEKKKGH